MCAVASRLKKGIPMKIRFWGVRGSIASPGPDTATVGGNTSCVEVLCGTQRILLDAGTGLRALGQHLITRGESSAPLALLLSHYHWDHIQGLPFFLPAYMTSAALTIVGAANGICSLRQTLEQQMSAPVFPVRFAELAARIEPREIAPSETFTLGDVQVRTARGHHPGGVTAYRLDHGGKSIVYATDTEHYACVDPALRALCDGADMLVYDAQYTQEEYGAKVGWGHSTYLAGAELARAAGVGALVLFHHDPARSDGAVADLEAKARALFERTVAAREGLEIEVGARSGLVAA